MHTLQEIDERRSLETDRRALVASFSRMRKAAGFVPIEKQHAGGVGHELILLSDLFDEDAAPRKHERVVHHFLFGRRTSPRGMAVHVVNSDKRTAKEAMWLEVIGHNPNISLSKQYSQVTDADCIQNAHDFESGKLAALQDSLLTDEEDECRFEWNNGKVAN